MSAMHVSAVKEYICTQESDFSIVYKVMSDLIWVVDLEGNIVGFNCASCFFVAKPPSDIIDKTRQEFLPMLIAQCFQKLGRRVLASLAPKGVRSGWSIVSEGWLMCTCKLEIATTMSLRLNSPMPNNRYYPSNLRSC